MLNWIVKGLLQWLYGLIWQGGEYIMNALMDVFSMDMSYFETAVPVSQVIMDIMFGVGWALLLGNLVFQAAKSMMTGIGFEGEDPRTLGMRTMVFMFLLVCSRQICDIGLGIGATVVDLLQVPSSVILPDLTEDMFGIDASWLLMIIVGIIIIFQLVKFFLEVGERYVIVGVLTILSPLAFAMGGSKNTMDIFKGWVRMYGSMCLMLVMNVVFMKMIISAMAVFPHGLKVFPWLILVIALARVARKIDSIVARIGLNPAITGDGLGRGLPGMMALMVGRNIASSVIGAKFGAGKAAASAVKGVANASNISGFKGGSGPAPIPINTGANTSNNALNNAPVPQPAVGMTNTANPISAAQQTGANSADVTPTPVNPPVGRGGTQQGKTTRPAGTQSSQQSTNPGGRGNASRGIPVSVDEPHNAADGSTTKPPHTSRMNAAAPVQPLNTDNGAGAAVVAKNADVQGKPTRPPLGSANTKPLDTSSAAAQTPAVSNSTNVQNTATSPVSVTSGGVPKQVTPSSLQGNTQVHSSAEMSQQGAQVQQNVQQNTQNLSHAGGNTAPTPTVTQSGISATPMKAAPAETKAASTPKPNAAAQPSKTPKPTDSLSEPKQLNPKQDKGKKDAKPSGKNHAPKPMDTGKRR